MPGMLKNKKGSLTVEAAVFLPMFVIGVLALGFLIRAASIQEGVLHAAIDEAGKASTEAYAVHKGEDSAYGDTIGEGVYRLRLYKRIKEEQGNQIENFQLDSLEYLVPMCGLEGMVEGIVSYRVEVPLSVWFKGDLDVSERLLFRGFIGVASVGTPMGFESMQEDASSNMVWVFPRAGEKYHSERCGVIAVCNKEHILTDSLKKAYDPCSHCKPETMPMGSKVFCFPTAGSAYHRKNCFTVERYVISMEKEEALEQGYGACMICGG